MLPASPERVWRSLIALDQYRSWWPWLERLRANELVDGARWDATVRAPLRYKVSFSLVLRDVEMGRSVAADLVGDIVGSAAISFRSADGGRATAVHLAAEVRPSRPLLVALTTLARPVARAGHDHIIDRALGQFATSALS